MTRHRCASLPTYAQEFYIFLELYEPVAIGIDHAESPEIRHFKRLDLAISIGVGKLERLGREQCLIKCQVVILIGIDPPSSLVPIDFLIVGATVEENSNDGDSQ